VLTFEQIKELIELVAARNLQELEVERSGFRLRIGGRPPAAPSPSAAPPALTVSAHSIAAAPESASAAPSVAADLHVIPSPIVGTFYAAPSPDAAPFVRVGDRVRKGQVLCIVEAMKLMNEIEGDADGEVAVIYPQNAQPVEYGEPLFALRLG